MDFIATIKLIMAHQFVESVDTFIYQQPESTHLLWETARQTILNQSTEIIEEIKWKLPFYSYHGMLCFLNTDKQGGLLVGLPNGASLTEVESLLIAKDRKRIRHYAIKHLEDATSQELISVLQAAMNFNRSG